MKTPVNRKLAAFVIADVVGYSRHMEVDDAGTISRLKQIREQIIDPKIAEFGGRIINIAGDEMLVEFESAAAALRTAIDVQNTIRKNNSSLSQDDRVEYRMGINLGDVLVDGSTIAGDGINIAARLAALAAPGGICVSGSVHEQVHGNIEVKFSDSGRKNVKNIERPIQVYCVDLESKNVGVTRMGREQWQNLAKRPWIRWLAIGASALGLAAVLATSPLTLWKTAATVSPPPLSVAVLPFAAPAARLEDQQFAGAFTRDLTMTLGRAHLARVVATSVASAYEDKPADARVVGRELGVRYLVQGEVTRADDKVVITVHFIDTGNGVDVWSDRTELDQARPGEARQELLSKLATKLRDTLVGAEIARASTLSRVDAPAIDILLQARAAEDRDPNTLRGALAARKLYDVALQRDPGLVPALIGRERTLLLELDLDLHANHERLIEEADQLSSRAIAIDGDSPMAWVYRAEALWRQWRWEAALEANAKASYLDPTFSSALIQRAFIMINMGRPVDALALIDRAAAIDVHHADRIAKEEFIRCIAYMTLDRYGDAVAACEKSAAYDDWWLTHLYLTAAYAHEGDTAKLAAERARLWREQPGLTISDFKALRHSDSPIYWQQTESHLLSDLRKAGISEE